jgi:hypothetical protein
MKAGEALNWTPYIKSAASGAALEQQVMNIIVHARLMATVLALPLLTPTPSLASECRVGPVAVEAPACDIVQGSHPEGPAQYAEWKEGGFIHTVIVIAPEKPRSFRGYFTRWRNSHKCSVKEVSFGHEVRFAGPEGAGRNGTPPQLTWTGVCITPGTFIARAIGLKRQVVELHATGAGGATDALEPAFAALLGRVRLSREN